MQIPSGASGFVMRHRHFNGLQGSTVRIQDAGSPQTAFPDGVATLYPSQTQQY